MKRQKIGTSNIEASRIALGCMRMADKTVEEAKVIIQTALEGGINFFDHADMYGAGKSESIFTEALKSMDVKREDIILQSKVGVRPELQLYDFSYDHIKSSVKGILERLDTDYIDILLLHRPDTMMEPEEIAKAFIELYEAKKVRAFGVSNFNPMQIELVQKYLPFPLITNQVQLSVMHTPLIDEGINVNHPFNKPVAQTGGLLEYSRLKDITLQAWSPYQYGFFEGTFIDNPKFPELNETMEIYAQKYGVTKTTIATAWILSHPAQIQVIAGSMTPSRINEITKATDFTLTKVEWYDIYKKAGNLIP